MLTFGSLFAGIGGMDLGLERAGMRCAWQVEIDEYATRVLAKHWPTVPRFRDVREVGAHNLTPVDLICGGFPCQDISNAGKRAGIEGQRSGLWSEYARIICELRPRYVLVENVAALLIRGIDKVLGDLAALGFDAEWQVVSAAQFGAPHIRERLFVLAYTWDGLSDAEQMRRRTGRNHHEGTTNGTSADRPAFEEGGRRRISSQATGTVLSPLHSAGNLNVWGSDRESMAHPPPIQRVADGVPCWLDRLRTCGNAVVPQVAQWIGEQIVRHAEGTN